LGLFLSNAVTQAADWERLFKEFACFHTKLRNHLDPDTTQQMTHVKYYMREEHGEDAAEPAAKKVSSNCMISDGQHKCVDTPLSHLLHQRTVKRIHQK
jgi:hypothetical protein